MTQKKANKEPDQTTLDQFVEVFGALNKHNLSLLSDIYSESVIFEDPAHQIIGLGNVMQYFAKMYDNVIECRFDIHDKIANENNAFLHWTMHLSHPKLRCGRHIEVTGCTYLTFDQGKVTFHRDFFDLGEMLYENLPIIGKLIKVLKKQLGQ